MSFKSMFFNNKFKMVGADSTEKLADAVHLCEKSDHPIVEVHGINDIMEVHLKGIRQPNGKVIWENGIE
jgi:hypothetical protein